MIRNATPILLLLLLSFFSRANDSIIIGNRAFNQIYDIQKPLQFGHIPLVGVKFIQLEKNFTAYTHDLIKTKDRFLLKVDGTGRVYEFVAKRNDSLYIRRIDSTIFFGYNGGSFTFQHKDTLMSFGGEGYWKTNGHLRYYSENNHEWNILPLNIEVPVTNVCMFYNQEVEKIQYIQTPYWDYGTNTYYPDFNVYSLDLKNKENRFLGKLNDELIKIFAQRVEHFTVPIPSVQMLLLFQGGSNFFLLDFKRNEMYQLVNTTIEKSLNASSKNVRHEIIFENNGYLYFTQSNDPTHQLDSIPISLKDFKKVGYRIYTPVSKLGNIYYLIIPGVVVLVLIAVIYSRRKSKEGKRIKIEQQFAMSDASDAIFKPMELELIQKIYAVSQLGKSYSVEDVNTALGLGKKSLEIQKKVRTDTLNRINHRYKMQFETQDDLIERVRSEEDRRYYRYFIREENMKKFVG
jgi:hypothetical protein